MRLESEWLHRLGGMAIAETVRLWMSTLDIQGLLHDPAVDYRHPQFQGPQIFIVWHEYLTLPFYVRGRNNTSLLIGRHRDAEWLARAARHMGLGTVRGSTSRGGITALRELFARRGSMNLVITPDGPRGPRRTLAPGAVYLSSRLQMPIVAVAVGYDRPWRLKSWDRFAIPRPLSRARLIAGPKWLVPPDLDRAALEVHRRQIEARLLEMTSQAEQWAASGRRWTGQVALKRELGFAPRGAGGVPPSRRPQACMTEVVWHSRAA